MTDDASDTATAAPLEGETSVPSTQPAAPPVTGDNPVLAKVVEALKNVFDPEIPVNIYELGLIYGLDITPDGTVLVRMTLTTPSCPVAGSLPGEVESAVRNVDGVNDCEVELVWDPPWTPEKLSEAAKLELGLL
jgi:FeS assembly SUF system protein